MLPFDRGILPQPRLKERLTKLYASCFPVADILVLSSCRADEVKLSLPASQTNKGGNEVEVEVEELLMSGILPSVTPRWEGLRTRPRTRDKCPEPELCKMSLLVLASATLVRLYLDTSGLRLYSVLVVVGPCERPHHPLTSIGFSIHCDSFFRALSAALRHPWTTATQLSPSSPVPQPSTKQALAHPPSKGWPGPRKADVSHSSFLCPTWKKHTTPRHAVKAIYRRRQKWEAAVRNLSFRL